MFASINYYFSDTNILEIVNTWVIKDKIKRGMIVFEEGDEVICFHRKANGHPRSIKDDVNYVVKRVDLDGHIIIAQRSSDGIGWQSPIRVHKTYMINKQTLRQIRINSILN
jgi:hypothetical protein